MKRLPVRVRQARRLGRKDLRSSLARPPDCSLTGETMART
jgi:hypothetical protein